VGDRCSTVLHAAMINQRGCGGRDHEAVHSLLIGFGLGFLVALQLGPMSLLLIRSTLRDGVRVGLAIGAGVAIVDALYAGLGAAGAAPLLTIGPLRLVLGIVGTLVLGWLAVRTLLSAVHVRAGLEGPADVGDPPRAFRTSLGATASNPLTIASWAGIFAAASTGTSASAVPLVLGVAVGSASWMTLLATGVAAARRAVGPRAVVAADLIAGLGLLGFAGTLGYRTTTDA
jgi:putative LysE/RhtB family amino acid efflux pump